MKRTRLALAYGLYGVAFLVVVFGLELSLRTILVVGAAIALCVAGNAVWKQAMPTSPFHRFQFRIDLYHLGQAFLDAGIYKPSELPSMDDIRGSMLGHGKIIFTWMDHGLVYLNTHNGFSSELEFSIYLRTFRDGVEVWNRRGDELEMRKTDTGYELVLIASETIGVEPRPYQYPGAVLLHLPYTLFSALISILFHVPLRGGGYLKSQSWEMMRVSVRVSMPQSMVKYPLVFARGCEAEMCRSMSRGLKPMSFRGVVMPGLKSRPISEARALRRAQGRLWGTRR
jgi:hypothetical protein